MKRNFHGVEIEQIHLCDIKNDQFDYKGVDWDINGDVWDIVQDIKTNAIYFIDREEVKKSEWR